MRYRSWIKSICRWKEIPKIAALCVFLGVGTLSAGNYTWTDGDTISDAVVWADDEGGATIQNQMNMDGNITIDGDVTIANTHVASSATDYFQITVDADTFIHPSAGSSNGFGHLIFYNAACCQTVIFVDNDLIFTGSNIDDRHADNRALTLTFSGQGQVVFHLANQKQVGFEGFFGDYTQTGWAHFFDDYSKTGSGVMTYVTMDQTYAQAIEEGKNKVVFERYYEYDSGLGDPTLSSTRDTVKISIGKNSFITYLSDIETGLLDCTSSSAVGYGSIAFDPMCYGAGRMLLRLKGANYVDSAGDIHGLVHAYNDGALVIAGHYVSDYTTAAGIRTGVNLTKPAGVDALFRIIDERAWADGLGSGNYQSGGTLSVDGTTGEPILAGGTYTGKPSRRGLLVVNECKSIPTFAADTYVNNQWKNAYVFQTQQKGSTAIRPGFVIGVNGTMEVFHNTFLDYVGTSTQIVNPYELDYAGAAIPTTRMKKHNPSALFVDGLGIFDLTNWDSSDPYANPLFPFTADIAGNGGRHAQVLLRGDARLYLRSGVQNDGYVNGLDWYTTPSLLGGYTIGLDRVYSFTINSDDAEGSYDGSFISGYATAGGLYYETEGEGNNVLDVEGELDIRSTADSNSTNDAGFVIHKMNREINPQSGTPCYMARHAVTDSGARGVLNVPPVKLDFMGREILNDLVGAGVASRPFDINTVYPCYNSSSIFLNAEMALHDVNWHHNDLLKIATPEQDKAEPCLVGGEKAAFDYYYWSSDSVGTTTSETLFVENPIEQINTKVPLVSLYTSTLFLHESFVASGVRFVVTDKFWYDPTESLGHPKLVPNVSAFMCYNHADPKDMLKRGYGRTLLLGSQQNTMADGITIGDYTQNAYLNVYRGWNTDGNASTWGDQHYLVRLSLETDAQPRYTIQYETRTTNPTGTDSFSKLTDSRWTIDQYKRVATHVFYLGNASFSSLGWTTTIGDQVISVADMRARDYATDGSYSYSFGINEGLRPRPWDASWGLGNRYDVSDTGASTPLPISDFTFSLSSHANDRAELYVNGDNYYFGGRDASGNLATEPVVAANESCIFYTNFGGKTHINQDTLSIDQGHYYDCFVDTIFAYRPWPRIKSDPTDPTSGFIDGLSGLVDLPHDQCKFGRSIQPYNLDFPTMLLANDGQTKENNVRLSVYDEDKYGVSPCPQRCKASGEEVSIAWNFRTDKSVRINSYEMAPTFTPVKMFGSEEVLGRDLKAEPFRHILGSRTTKWAEQMGAATMPESVLTVSTGDVITQMRVSGATKADPFHLYVSGGHRGYGIVREFTSLAANYFNPGEGSHAAILMDAGAHIGLGPRNWNEHSSKAWSVLGYDYVTLYPNGNCFVWVNSDLIVADGLAIIPTTNFGSYDNDAQVVINEGEDQRITFYSAEPREIRIPEGGELDLSAFGEPAGTVGGGQLFPQQIEFAGRLRLIFEPGSRLRFPSDPTYQPVLYMNDGSELIFETSEDRDALEYSSLDESDAIRSKVLGSGQIWLNKTARMRIVDGAVVGIETDLDKTVTTSVVISIQRQGALLLGSENIAGGTLQVGNPEDRSGRIDFTINLRSPEAQVIMRRGGFLGLGVGAVRKPDVINGDSSEKSWSFKGLYNVASFTLDMQNGGVFDHNQIYDGDDRNASLMAIGPIGTYYADLGPRRESIIKGGGNILYIDAIGDTWPATDGYNTTIIGSSPSMTGGTTGDYTILGATGLIRQVTSVPSGVGTVTGGVDARSFVGDAQGFYNYIKYPDLSVAATPLIVNPYAAFGETGSELRIAYILVPLTAGTEAIVRDSVTGLDDESTPAESLKYGEAKAILAIAPGSIIPRTQYNGITQASE